MQRLFRGKMITPQFGEITPQILMRNGSYVKKLFFAPQIRSLLIY